jgi:hypothetical protein
MQEYIYVIRLYFIVQQKPLRIYHYPYFRTPFSYTWCCHVTVNSRPPDLPSTACNHLCRCCLQIVLPPAHHSSFPFRLVSPKKTFSLDARWLRRARLSLRLPRRHCCGPSSMRPLPVTTAATSLCATSSCSSFYQVRMVFYFLWWLEVDKGRPTVVSGYSQAYPIFLRKNEQFVEIIVSVHVRCYGTSKLLY